MRSTLLFLLSASAALGSEIAVYWGQNAAYSTGTGSQERLLEYCQKTPSDIVLLSFLNGYPKTELNFANQCGGTFPGTNVLHCPQISSDIKACQDMGKKVLLTLGGATGNYGFDNDEAGAAYAKTLLDMFGKKTADSLALRPFDDAVVDGFNLDPEAGNATPYTALANELKKLAPEILLGAAPQCVFPDRTLGDALDKASFDYVFVQFYNNYCSLDGEFNWKVWSEYAKTTSINKNVKIFIGLLGAAGGPDKGYVDTATIKKRLSEFTEDPAFGGFALWDASSAQANNNYGLQLKELLSTPPLTTSIEPSNSSADPLPASSSEAPLPSPVSSTKAPLPSPAAPLSSKQTSTPISIETSRIELSSSFYPAPSNALPIPNYPRFSNSSLASNELISSSTPTPIPTKLMLTTTDIHTTVVTITDCGPRTCTEREVTTGVVVVTENETVYTTYCPLATETAAEANIAAVSTTTCENDVCTEQANAAGVTDFTESPSPTQTVTDVLTTTVTITTCESEVCAEQAVTTGVTYITIDKTVYTTFCPLPTTTSPANPVPNAGPTTKAAPKATTATPKATKAAPHHESKNHEKSRETNKPQPGVSPKATKASPEHYEEVTLTSYVTVTKSVTTSLTFTTIPLSMRWSNESSSFARGNGSIPSTIPNFDSGAKASVNRTSLTLGLALIAAVALWC